MFGSCLFYRFPFESRKIGMVQPLMSGDKPMQVTFDSMGSATIHQSVTREVSIVTDEREAYSGALSSSQSVTPNPDFVYSKLHWWTLCTECVNYFWETGFRFHDLGPPEYTGPGCVQIRHGDLYLVGVGQRCSGQ